MLAIDGHYIIGCGPVLSQVLLHSPPLIRTDGTDHHSDAALCNYCIADLRNESDNHGLANSDVVLQVGLSSSQVPRCNGQLQSIAGYSLCSSSVNTSGSGFLSQIGGGGGILFLLQLLYNWIIIG